MTIRDLLEALDGNGLVLTDDDLLEEALAEMGLAMETEIETDQEDTVPASKNVRDQ